MIQLWSLNTLRTRHIGSLAKDVFHDSTNTAWTLDLSAQEHTDG